MYFAMDLRSVPVYVRTCIVLASFSTGTANNSVLEINFTAITVHCFTTDHANVLY